MAEDGKLSVSTTIRNLYSDEMSYLGMQFYNLYLSFKFARFLSKDSTGRSSYDNQNTLTTSVDYSGAYALYKAASDIVEGKESSQGTHLVIPCNEASLVFERRPGQNGQMDTFISISKNNMTIPFKFTTHQIQQKENGQMITKTIESGLGAFIKTIEGYLTGINADRHLDKLTEEYVKLQEGKPQQGFQSGSGYQNKGNWNNNKKGNWNNNRKNYNNNYGNQAPPQTWESTPPNQQNMSDYNIPQ